MACVVELHKEIDDINEWLRADVGYGAINELLEQRGKERVPDTTLSRHRSKCLGLPKKAVVREKPPVQTLKAPKPILPLPTDQELLDEAKRVIYWQMKENPSKVPLATLATIIAASLKDKKPDNQDAMRKILEQLGTDSPQDTETVRDTEELASEPEG